MAKLYLTKEIKGILNRKISETVDQLINDDNINESQMVPMIKQIRILRTFADEVIAGMEAEDKAEDERMEAEQKKEAEPDG